MFVCYLVYDIVVVVFRSIDGVCCVNFPDGDKKYFALDRDGWKWHIWRTTNEESK